MHHLLAITPLRRRGFVPEFVLRHRVGDLPPGVSLSLPILQQVSQDSCSGGGSRRRRRGLRLLGRRTAAADRQRTERDGDTENRSKFHATPTRRSLQPVSSGTPLVVSLLAAGSGKQRGKLATGLAGAGLK